MNNNIEDPKTTLDPTVSSAIPLPLPHKKIKCLCCVENKLVNVLRNKNECITYHKIFNLSLGFLHLSRHNIISKTISQDKKKDLISLYNI